MYLSRNGDSHSDERRFKITLVRELPPKTGDDRAWLREVAKYLANRDHYALHPRAAICDGLSAQNVKCCGGKHLALKNDGMLVAVLLAAQR